MAIDRAIPWLWRCSARRGARFLTVLLGSQSHVRPGPLGGDDRCGCEKTLVSLSKSTYVIFSISRQQTPPKPRLMTPVTVSPAAHIVKFNQMSTPAASAAASRAVQLESALRRVIRGKDDVLRLALVSIFAKGHLLIEGVPGVGKTTLGQALARAIDCTFQRIQFTSDMLPSDVLGISIYSAIEQKFEFKRGPVFANVLLADEINRTTPKTQSALLEAMNEGQVTIDAHSYQLPQPFLVLATQNPIEHHGTYPLPESQLDRF